MRGFTEFLKNLTKLSGVGLIAFVLLKSDPRRMAAAIFSDPTGLADHLLDFAIRLISRSAS